MNRTGTLPTLLAAGSLATAADGLAQIAPVTAADLYASCLAYRGDPDSSDGRACATYVRGFHDGAKEIGAASAEPRRESFRERALRTRVGSRHTPSPRYCLHSPVSLDRFVVELLSRRLANPENRSAGTAVDATFRRLYDCRPR